MHWNATKKPTKPPIFEANEDDYEFDEYGQLIRPDHATEQEHEEEEEEEEPVYEEEFSHARRRDNEGQELLGETGLRNEVYWDDEGLKKVWKAALLEFKIHHPTSFSSPPPLAAPPQEKHASAPLWYGPTPIASTSTSPPAFPIPPLGSTLPSTSDSAVTATPTTSTKRKATNPTSFNNQQRSKKQRLIGNVSAEGFKELQSEFKSLQRELLDLEKSKFGLGGDGVGEGGAGEEEEGKEEGELSEIEEKIQERRSVLVGMKAEIKDYQKLLSEKSRKDQVTDKEEEPTKVKGKGKGKGKGKDATRSKSPAWAPTSPNFQRALSIELSLPPPKSTLGPQLPQYSPTITAPIVPSHLPSPPPQAASPAPLSLPNPKPPLPHFAAPNPPPIVPLSSSDLDDLERTLRGGETGDGEGREGMTEALEKCMWNWYNAGYETALYHVRCLEERRKKAEEGE